MMFDIYEEITNRIIREIEKGVIPWQRPWRLTNGAVSYDTGKPYSLLNQILLSSDEEEPEEESKEFLTFNQVKTLGGNVKKGAKSKFIVFWKMYKKEYENNDGEKREQTIPVLRYYNVFEVSQCENIERRWTDKEKAILKPIEDADNLINLYFDRETCKLEIKESNQACYIPDRDVVIAPRLSQYENESEYYSTLFHEIVHSTGHKSRLDRLSNWKPRSQEYSREELVAELGSVYLLNKLGIECEKTFKNSCAYLEGWGRALKGDKKLFAHAACKAEKAINYIINGKEQENVD
ncbi:MAG: DUF1738 domain-containing protein [Muribaculaceae bacterium]|nr:DUF1738 domain-containing protein [Muribaculaceae bacterium]